MFKRTVPLGHGVISKNPNDEQWKRRKDHYPHPGDCYPATGIIMPGETGRVLVYVCKKCEAAKKEVDAKASLILILLSRCSAIAFEQSTKTLMASDIA